MAFTAVTPFAGVEPVGEPGHLDWLAEHLPLIVSHYIEDQDPEWRDLDYSIDVGEPPTDFFQFVRQYDWGVYYCDKTATAPDLNATMTPSSIEDAYEANEE